MLEFHILIVLCIRSLLVVGAVLADYTDTLTVTRPDLGFSHGPFRLGLLNGQPANISSTLRLLTLKFILLGLGYQNHYLLGAIS
jgi:hypothetical protein